MLFGEASHNSLTTRCLSRIVMILPFNGSKILFNCVCDRINAIILHISPSNLPQFPPHTCFSTSDFSSAWQRWEFRGVPHCYRSFFLHSCLGSCCSVSFLEHTRIIVGLKIFHRQAHYRLSKERELAV